ncbi:AI-2E family transporter [Paracoccus aurantiacus]|uniref:AI-2E family transporter n=1 Tax=Paracoccus aurantiacus TaxID=2599412 RepID=A0A5C6S1I9_9RHOB|nr:AI-2E family transporter [Paracoccus aurantiacus]TXB68449.1 AI-2E family transporter [Paracoccus aurantiacus]
MPPPKPRYSPEHRFPTIQREEDAKPPLVPRWAIIGIFMIMLFYFVTAASAFLMPVTLGLLLFFVFVPFRRLLSKFGIGASISAALVTLGMIALVVVLGYFISGPIRDIVDDSPQITSRLEERLRDLRESVRPLEEAAAKLDEVTGGGAQDQEGDAPPPPAATVAATEVVEQPAEGDKPIQVEVKTDESSTLASVMAAGPSVVGQIVFTLFLLFFLLASGDLMYLKIVQSFDSLKEKRAAYMALREIELALGSYLGAITLINAGLGLCIGLGMWIWDMPQPLLWGVAAFILNFIPYLGAVTGVAASFVVALISFSDIFTPFMVAATYLGLTSLEGQLITPYFVSRRLRLNTVVVFVTVALWAWLWSVLGMVVAVPMLVVMKVLADHIPGLEKFGNFLAGEDPPALEDEDEEEARDLVEAGDSAETLAEVSSDTAEVVAAGQSQ